MPGDARQYLSIDGDFQMQHGRLVRPRIAFETLGNLNTNASNAILVLTGLSASAHIASNQEDSTAGWWEDMVGPGKPIDTDRFFVICVNSLGSYFGSTCPASINPDTGLTYRLDFPTLTLEDVAHAAKLVVDSLEINRLHSVVGPSMGGMSALAYVLLYPHGSESLLSISSGTCSLPFSIAMRSLQRELVCHDPTWMHGEYPLDEQPSEGMRLARKLGMISYRSAQEWRSRFGRERATDAKSLQIQHPFGMNFEIESYLEARAVSFSSTFDANCFLYLSRAMDLFDAADHGGSVEAAFDLLAIERATVIGVKSDFLFPPEQQCELHESIVKKGIDIDFHLLDSIQGHDSFLVDMQRFRPVIAEHFNR